MKSIGEFKDFRIVIDFKESILSLESECGFYRFIDSFNNNKFPYEYTCDVEEYIGRPELEMGIVGRTNIRR